MQLDSVSGQKLNRFSCCVHKANNAIKKAIQSIPVFSKDLSELTKWTKSVRKRNPKTKIFEIKSSRLRCENKTRWSSGFLNLISVYKAYKNKVNEVADCPLDFEKIKFYLQILLPAYRFTTSFQKTDANISQIVPALLAIIQTWSKFSFKKKFKTICKVMIESFEERFEYELNSNVHLVSSLLNTEKLEIWYWKNFSEKYAAKAKDELINVVMNYVNEEFKTVAPKQIQKNKNKRFEDDDMLFGLFDSDNDSDLKKNNENNSGPCSINSIMVKLRKKKELFLSLINNDDNSKLKLKSKEFWIEFRNKLPIL